MLSMACCKIRECQWNMYSLILKHAIFFTTKSMQYLLTVGRLRMPMDHKDTMSRGSPEHWKHSDTTF